MSIETPMVSAVIARLANAETNLAAFSGIVFPLAFIIEAPIVMLLSASTALSKDWPSYHKVWKFMMIASGILTLLHLIIVLTPLYDFIVRDLLGVPEQIIAPARLGLTIMLPWVWSIAYRRFHQGVLIRFGHSRLVSIGTGVRLLADILVLSMGYLLGNVQGIVVGSAAVAAGVVAEAVYIGIVAHPVVKLEVRTAALIAETLTTRAFFAFYLPLVMTAFLSFLSSSITSAALSRMPLAIESLAIWSALNGLNFSLRSPGVAYNEVVVALLDEAGSYKALRQFAWKLLLVMSLVIILFTATPISGFWFQRLTALKPALANLAQQAMWLALPMPALATAQSWFQGIILHSRKTRSITESVIIFLTSISLAYLAGIAWGKTAGLFVGVAGLTLSSLVQVAWLWLRSRKLPHEQI